MDETIIPPTPNWYSSKICASNGNNCFVYGSKKNIVILNLCNDKNVDFSVISSAHNDRVSGISLPPANSIEPFQNAVASCSDDGFVKLWNLKALSAISGHKAHWEVKEPQGKVIAVDWSLVNYNFVVSGADNNTIVLWNILDNFTTKFYFGTLKITTLACCPHNEKIVAVGGKSGLINILNLSGKGIIVHRLRGHDNDIHSLSWCPTPYNIFRKSSVIEEFLLASTCMNKEVFIWRAGSDGKCETKFHIPNALVSTNHYVPNKKNIYSFSAIFWENAYTLYFSSSSGELLYFDVEEYLNKLPESFESNSNRLFSSCIKVVHSLHIKGLTALTGTPTKGIVNVYDNIEINSALKFKIESENNVLVKLSSEKKALTNFKWKVERPIISSLLWTAGQDRKLIACKFSISKLEIIFNLHTLIGGVCCMVVSPHDPNKMAFGVSDGVIRMWNFSKPCGEIQTFWRKVKDCVMSLAWHPIKDGLLAYGTSEGRIGVFDTNSNKDPSVFKPSSPKPIYNLTWGPCFQSNNTDSSKKDFDLYFIVNNMLSLNSCSRLNADPINLSKLIPFKCKSHTDVSWKSDYSLMAVGSEDGAIDLVEPNEFKIIFSVAAYKKLIQSIAWHPLSTSVDSGLSPYHGYFTSGSTDKDNNINIFNCINDGKDVKVEQVGSLKGHHGFIRAVSWSPHVGARLVSCSADESVQIWDVKTLSPLINFSGMEQPMISIFSPVNPDIILSGSKYCLMYIWKISSQSNILPLPKSKNKKKTKLQKTDKNLETLAKDTEVIKKLENEIEPSNCVMAETKISEKVEKEIKMFSKAWKENPVSGLDICYAALKGKNAVNGGLELFIPFFGTEDSNQNLIDCEEETRKKSNNWTEYYELVLWNGKIKEVIEEKIKSRQLNDFLVSLAPTISIRLWQEACLAYSKCLEEKKMFRKAASYLTVCHKIYEALDLLTNNNLYLEALCLGRSRLPKSDPVFMKILRRYAQWLFENGSTLKASQCYIYLEDYREVARICGKKNVAEYLSLAALAAKKCGFEELELSEASKALLKCLEENNFELAQRICDDHNNFEYLRIMYLVNYTIHKIESDELILEKDILSYIKESVEFNEKKIHPEINRLYRKYSYYKTKQEMWIVAAQELSFAIMASDTKITLKHIIQALSTCNRYISSVDKETHPLVKLCRWLSHSGQLYESPYLDMEDSELQSAIKSLREFFGAAVVQFLNSKEVVNSPENLEWIDVLYKFRYDFLDEDSFQYYKNLSEINLCEVRLMSYCKASTFTNIKNEHTLSESNEGRDKNNFLTVSNHHSVLENGKLSEANKATNESITLKHNIIENEEKLIHLNTANEIEEKIRAGHSQTDFANSCKIESGDFEEKAIKDKNLLNKLKKEIEYFENVRISSPNPVHICFLLHTICKAVPESETALALLEFLEEKLKNFN